MNHESRDAVRVKKEMELFTSTSILLIFKSAMKLFSGRAAFRLLTLLLVLGALAVYTGFMLIRMPGKSFQGDLPPLSSEEEELAEQLRELVSSLAGEIGERNIWTPKKYELAAHMIEDRLRSLGYDVNRDTFQVSGVACSNLEGEVPGAVRPEEILVIGAHYDTVVGCPGANDNTSGVAGMLALASLFKDARPERTIRFVAFANEEAPFFHTANMGSLRYATQARERRENIVGMISLETIGYYSDEEKSQQYPFPFHLFYPSRGNFIGFISNMSGDSRAFQREVVSLFRQNVSFPSEGAALPQRVPGVGWSDHWAFWENGYPALMVTDTAPYRYPYYHSSEDTPEKLDYLKMARVVKGMEAVVSALADRTGPSQH